MRPYSLFNSCGTASELCSENGQVAVKSLWVPQAIAEVKGKTPVNHSGCYIGPWDLGCDITTLKKVLTIRFQAEAMC